MTTTEPVRIVGIDQRPTRAADVQRYVIRVARTQPADSALSRWFSVSTIDPWQASLCARAHAQAIPITLTWRANRFFEQDLIDVALLDPARPA
jgi:hypothetical protein